LNYQGQARVPALNIIRVHSCSFVVSPQRAGTETCPYKKAIHNGCGSPRSEHPYMSCDLLRRPLLLLSPFPRFRFSGKSSNVRFEDLPAIDYDTVDGVSFAGS